MSNKQKRESESKRLAREQRQKKQRQQQMRVIGIVAAIGLVVVILFAVSTFLINRSPAGEFVRITPGVHPFADGTTLGEANAPVTVEIFSDFQCPACRSFDESIEPLIVANYVQNGIVRYVYRHYAFLDSRSSTKESQQAANASECAAEQNRFWDYHDIIFKNWNGENQGAFRDSRLVAFAESLDLNMDEWQACFEDNRYKEKIDADRAEGDSRGVTGTPSIFVNGLRVGEAGRVPAYEEISQAIEAVRAGQ